MNTRAAFMLAAMLVMGQSPAAQTPAPAKPASPPAAQTPAPATPASPPATALQAPAQNPAQPQAEPYTYKPEGRRDPFVSLLARGVEPSTQTKGPTGSGIGSLTTLEISVRGIVRSRGTYVAMVRSSDGKTYIVHVNDRLSDGVVKEITLQGLVVQQEVNDPLSLVKQREVRKNLRSVVDEGK